MPCPTKRKGSNNWYFRRRVPNDIQRLLSTQRAKRPSGWHKTDIWISLRTADCRLAKERCVAVAASVDETFRALREGPKDLNPEQLSALSGIAYRAFTENLSSDPVLSAAAWREIAEANREGYAPPKRFRDSYRGASALPPSALRRAVKNVSVESATAQRGGSQRVLERMDRRTPLMRMATAKSWYRMKAEERSANARSVDGEARLRLEAEAARWGEIAERFESLDSARRAGHSAGHQWLAGRTLSKPRAGHAAE